MEIKDISRFGHMLESTKAILTYAKGRKRIDLDKDRQFLSAILREFEILGEAGSKVSEKGRKRFPDIPWKELIGMRNRLIHAYFDVDHDIIWKAVREDLHSLQKQLEHAILLFQKES